MYVLFAYAKYRSIKTRLLKYTMKHKFSNFHMIFKMQIGRIFNPSIFNALAIIISNFDWNITFS